MILHVLQAVDSFSVCFWKWKPGYKETTSILLKQRNTSQSASTLSSYERNPLPEYYHLSTGEGKKNKKKSVKWIDWKRQHFLIQMTAQPQSYDGKHHH